MDIMLVGTEGGQRCQLFTDMKSDIADAVVGSGFGISCAAKEMIPIRVKGCVFGTPTGSANEVGGKNREVEFALIEKTEEVIWNTVVLVLTGVAVEWEASEAVTDGGEC